MCEVSKIRLSEKMAEGGNVEPPPATETAAEVRVVRCPKCKKLLPELVGVNIYRCGGCNAALQANKSATVTVMATSLEKSDDDRSNACENVGVTSCKQEIPSNAYKIDETIHEFEGKEKMFPGRDGGFTETFASEANPSASKVVSDEHGLGNINFPSTGKQNSYGSAPYCYPSEAFHIGDNCSDLDQAVIADSEDCNGKKRQGNGAYMAQTSCQFTANKSREGQGTSGPWRTTLNSSSYGVRFSPYPDEGSSNCRQSSIHGCDVDRPKYRSHGLPDRVEHLEHDRAELLKKLDELRNQLSRSCEIKDGPTGRLPTRTAPANHQEHHGTDDLVHACPPSSNGPSTPHFPLQNGHDPILHHYHSALQNHDDFLGHREPFGLPFRRTPKHLSRQYPDELPNSYLDGFYSPHSLIPYHADAFHHQPICSHLNLHNKQFHMPSRCPLASFGNRRAPYLTTCHECYPVDDPATVGIANHNRRNATSIHSHNPSIPQKQIFKQQNGRWCHPIGGGAPFIVCSNCYQLMQVPHKLLLRDKNRHKLRCGSCFYIISFEVDGNHLIVSDSMPNFATSLEPRNNSSEGRTGGVNPGIYRNGTIVFPVSEDHDSSNYNVYSADEKFILSPPTLDVASHEIVEREHDMNLVESKNVEGLYSISASEEGRIIDSVIYQREKSTSAELSQKSDTTTRGASVPLREHFGCSSLNHGGNRSETGSRSARSDQDKVVSANASFKQNSVKDVLMATEMDFPADEYPNHVLSQDSPESYEDDLPRMSKGGESFLTGLIKKGFRDLSRTNQSSENGRFKVSVNGHRVPDRLIKKAEKQAGLIQPGDYWYDYRAGFWGVMGQPCIGIIPPFIEEFNYPMPKNCSGGNTGVIVNGRELHQKDLDLLAGRGLPTSRNSSYVIEISGRVLNAITGEELDCLGKLAPTVEKVKHGFGMRVPAA